MPRVDRSLTRICVRIFKEDDDALEIAAALGGLKKNHIIRSIINSYVTQLSARERAKIDETKPVTSPIILSPVLEMTLDDETIDIDLDEIEE